MQEGVKSSRVSLSPGNTLAGLPAAMWRSCTSSLGFQGFTDSPPASKEVLRAGESYSLPPSLKMAETITPANADQ